MVSKTFRNCCDCGEPPSNGCPECRDFWVPGIPAACVDAERTGDALDTPSWDPATDDPIYYLVPCHVSLIVPPFTSASGDHGCNCGALGGTYTSFELGDFIAQSLGRTTPIGTVGPTPRLTVANFTFNLATGSISITVDGTFGSAEYTGSVDVVASPCFLGASVTLTLLSFDDTTTQKPFCSPPGSITVSFSNSTNCSDTYKLTSRHGSRPTSPYTIYPCDLYTFAFDGIGSLPGPNSPRYTCDPMTEYRDDFSFARYAGIHELGYPQGELPFELEIQIDDKTSFDACTACNWSNGVRQRVIKEATNIFTVRQWCSQPPYDPTEIATGGNCRCVADTGYVYTGASSSDFQDAGDLAVVTTLGLVPNTWGGQIFSKATYDTVAGGAPAEAVEDATSFGAYGFWDGSVIDLYRDPLAGGNCDQNNNANARIFHGNTPSTYWLAPTSTDAFTRPADLRRGDVQPDVAGNEADPGVTPYQFWHAALGCKCGSLAHCFAVSVSNLGSLDLCNWTTGSPNPLAPQFGRTSVSIPGGSLFSGGCTFTAQIRRACTGQGVGDPWGGGGLIELGTDILWNGTAYELTYYIEIYAQENGPFLFRSGRMRYDTTVIVPGTPYVIDCDSLPGSYTLTRNALFDQGSFAAYTGISGGLPSNPIVTITDIT